MDCTRTMSRLVAATGVAAMLAIAAPAFAADYHPLGKSAACVVSAKTASASKRDHTWLRYRVASWYASHFRYSDAVPAVVQPASWSSRPVPLMVGIAY